MSFHCTHWRRAAKQLTLILCTAFSGAASAVVAPGYTMSTRDVPGSTFTQAFDVDEAGTMVGATSIGGRGHGYLLTIDGAVTLIPGPAAALGAMATGLGAGGLVVGSYHSSTTLDGEGQVIPGPQTGFLLDGGVYSDLALPGATDTHLRGVSPDGRYVTGYGAMATGGSDSFVTIATSPALTIAQGVTNAGTVVGNLIVPGAPIQRYGFSYRLPTGALETFQFAGVIDTRFRGINGSGTLSGFYRDGAGSHGFVGLPEAFQTIEVVGALNTFVEGINDAGWLAGTYEDGAGVFHAFLAMPVPEPGMGLLLAGGLGFLAARRRRP